MSVLYFSDTRTSTEKPSKHTKIIEPHGYKLLRQVWALVQAECHDPPSVFPTEQKNPISGIMRVDYNDSRVVLALAYPLWGKDRYAAQRSPHTQEEKHLTEFEAMEIVGLIRSGLPAQEACRLVNVPQSTLTAALTAARKQADNATEKQKLLLKGYEDAQARRSKLLRKRHETGQPLPSGKAVIYRDLLTFPAEIKEKIFAHLRHGILPGICMAAGAKRLIDLAGRKTRKWFIRRRRLLAIFKRGGLLHRTRCRSKAANRLTR